MKLDSLYRVIVAFAIQLFLFILCFLLSGNGTIEFDEFCEMMQRKINQPDNDDELKEAFR